MDRSAVVLLSGGLDSTTALYLLLTRTNWSVTAVVADYCQRHRGQEISAALKLIRRAGMEFPGRVDNQFVYYTSSVLQKSSLVNTEEEVPKQNYSVVNQRSTVVPGRNTIFTSMAMNVAINIGADIVTLGIHAGDSPTYPDCSTKWAARMAELLHVAHYTPIELFTPFLLCRKSDIIRIGVGLGVPYQDTYSCYTGEENHCGVCGTCRQRMDAFRCAGVPDPTVYGLPSTNEEEADI